MLNSDGIACVGLEWQTSGEKLVSNHRQTVVITTDYCLSACLLWCHIFGRANARTSCRQAITYRQHTCNAEIRQQKPVIFAQKHIARFNIAMDHVLLVGMIDCFSRLREERKCLRYKHKRLFFCVRSYAVSK